MARTVGRIVRPTVVLVVDALRERGTQVIEELVEATAPASSVRVWTAATMAAVVRSVAARVRQRLLAEPDARIGLVTPALSAYGSRVERVFEEGLDPVVCQYCVDGMKLDAELPMFARRQHSNPVSCTKSATTRNEQRLPTPRRPQ